MDEIRQSDKDYLIPKDVAEVFNCNPHYIRVEAKNGTLPFRFVRTGSRTKIPRKAFIRWMDGQTGPEK